MSMTHTDWQCNVGHVERSFVFSWRLFLSSFFKFSNAISTANRNEWILFLIVFHIPDLQVGTIKFQLLYFCLFCWNKIVFSLVERTNQLFMDEKFFTVQFIQQVFKDIYRSHKKFFTSKTTFKIISFEINQMKTSESFII